MGSKTFLKTMGTCLFIWASMGAHAQTAQKFPTVDQIAEAGYAASFMCSGVFIAGRTPEQINALELSAADGQPNGYALTMDSKPATVSIDKKRRIVTATFDESTPPILAAHRDGLGCSVLPWGAGPDASASLPRLSKRRPRFEKDDMGWPKRGPLQPAQDAKPYQDALNSVVDKTFKKDGYGNGVRTTSVIVIDQGEVVVERYRDGFGPHTQYRTWSTAKSLASAIVGVAIKDGVLPSVEAPAPIPEWARADDPRRLITLENLLHMASGLKTVNPEDGSDTTLAYTAGINTAADATGRPLIHKPGSLWHYSNYDTLLLMRSLKAALRKEQRYLNFPYTRLFDRIGMHDTFAETDAYGNFVLSSQVFTTARDLARFAYLYLNDGVWEGKRILPEGWAQYSCTPTKAEIKFPENNRYGRDFRYGAQWWIYDLEFPQEDGLEDFSICTTRGARGQFAAFVPEHDMVIVRQGVDEWEGGGLELKDFFTDVIRAVKGRQSGAYE